MRVHFLGIGGSGASGAAAIAQAQGFEVSGCDLNPHNEFTTQFKPNQLLKGHSASHLTSGNVDVLAVTPAIFSLDPNNPELLEARKRGAPILTWQQFLGKYLVKEKFVIATAGTHGKSTTTAMIAQLLEDAGADPTALLGANIPRWKANFRIGKSKYFVIEADEFNDNFLSLKPNIAVVTNIEMDHPEYFKDYEAVKNSFYKFLLQTKQTAVVNLTDPGIAEVTKNTMKHSGATYLDYSKNDLSIELKIPGEFNRLNAKAAMQVGLILGIEGDVIKQSLGNFTGASRRFEYIGNYNNAQVYSDFGHHPTEIKVTIEAARQKFPENRILLIFQPHMFSRTKALFDNFVDVLKNVSADKTFIMDIYPSREIDTGLVTSKQLVETINKPNVSYIGSASETLDKLKPDIKSGDTVFFMSAGDTDILAKKLIRS